MEQDIKSTSRSRDNEQCAECSERTTDADRLRRENEGLKHSKAKLHEEIAKLHQKLNEDNASLEEVVDSFINSDYVFSLCTLLKHTVAIKQMLGTDFEFELFIQRAEDLIADIEKSASVFRPAAMFSSIVDQCVNLSEALQSDSAYSWSANTLQILLSIEHILKEELGLALGSHSFDKKEPKQSNGFDFDAKAGSEQEDVEYWSDFSDDDFTQEEIEENKAIEVVSALKRWMQSSNFELELIQKFAHRQTISLDDLKEVLQESGFH